MKAFFEIYPIAAWSIVSVMLALVVMVALWDKIKWWWQNTTYSFPVIGGIARLSRDLNRDHDKVWFKSELTLCRDYKKFIDIRDEHDFNEKITYLTKAGDLGRKETPPWIWILTSVLVFVEAMGFSYVLAGWTIPGASEHLQQTGAYGIALLISVILVAFTHFSGHELFKSGQIKHARREWAEDGRKHKFTTGPVPLARAQSSDDDQPSYTQLANRIGTHPTFNLTIATVVFVVIVAVFATYVRGQVLEKQLLDQTIGSQVGGSDNPYAQVLPDADVSSQTAAAQKAQADESSIQRHGGWGTFIVLAFIFIFLQILGVVFGFRWGFGGRESSAAYRALGKGRYSSYADVRQHVQRISDTAQAKLEQLQQRLMDRNAREGTDGMHATKTFYNFLDNEREREFEARQQEVVRTARQHESTITAAKTLAVEAVPRAVQETDSALSELESLRQAVAAAEQKKRTQDDAQKHDEIAALRARLSELGSDSPS